jgi:hypothetical protein
VVSAGQFLALLLLAAGVAILKYVLLLIQKEMLSESNY